MLRLLLAWLCLLAPWPAAAHDPLDGSIALVVLADRLEANITLGQDAAKQLMRHERIDERVIGAILHPREAGMVELPVALGARLMSLREGSQARDALSVVAVPSELEIQFRVRYAAAGQPEASVTATYFEVVPGMKPSPLSVKSVLSQTVLFNGLLTQDRPTAVVPLRSDAVRPAQTASAFIEFLGLGFRHILEGADHLLFLLALLLRVKVPRQMVAVVTAFTLAHSTTLVLSAYGWIGAPSRVVEPLVAASVLWACAGNLLRSAEARPQYLLTFVFGLVHGLAFADGLQARLGVDAGSGRLLALIGFNLGVEAGQLVVAAVCLPLLWWLRRRPRWDRVARLVLSWGGLLLACAWLWQRVAAGG